MLALSGRIDVGYISELERLLGPPVNYSKVIIDLSDVRLADRAAVRFLARCESRGVRLENCPDYIREWMRKENPNFNEQEGLDDGG
jgi:hypothetical protein